MVDPQSQEREGWQIHRGRRGRAGRSTVSREGGMVDSQSQGREGW